MENGGEFTLGWEEVPEAFQDSPPQAHDNSRTATENDAYGTVLARLRQASNEIAGSVHNSLSTEKPEVLAKAVRKSGRGDGSRKKQRRVRPTSRWQVGHSFSSESDSDEGGDLLAPFGSSRAAPFRTIGSHKESGSPRDSAPEASKRSGAPAKQGGRWANAARARLGFSSDSEAGGGL